MNVLVTGSYGRCGTAIIDHLAGRERYSFTFLNRSDRPEDHEYGGYDTVVADVADYESIRPAFEGQDAVLHLAAYPYTDGDWEDILEPNVVGMQNVLRCSREAAVESMVFGSTNHVMGMYEEEFAPELYEVDHDLLLTATDPERPDSFYGASKSFGEDLGRYYVEEYEHPRSVYALRICSVRWPSYDHPYGDAEAGVDDGEWERNSAAYDRAVRRMKAMWHSRRDFAQLVDRCLRDEHVEFDVFHGVSDNDRRWFDLGNARERLGYDPADNAEHWEGPPT